MGIIGWVLGILGSIALMTIILKIVSKIIAGRDVNLISSFSERMKSVTHRIGECCRKAGA